MLLNYMEMLLYLFVNTAAVIIAAYLLPGVTLNSMWTGVVVAIIIGVVMTFIRPVLVALTLPINIITLGLFSFVINAALILLVANIVQGFQVASFWWALLFSLILSLVSSLLFSVVTPS